MSIEEKNGIHRTYSEIANLSSEESQTVPAQKTIQSSLMDKVIVRLSEDLKKSRHNEAAKKECEVRIQSLKGVSGRQFFREITSIEALFYRHSIVLSSESLKVVKRVKQHLRSESEEEIGQGKVSLVDQKSSFVPCYIKRSTRFSRNIGMVVTVFNAYVPGEKERVGRCKFRFSTFDECRDVGYPDYLAAGVLGLDSFARKKYRGIGTLLMQAVMEYGRLHRTMGRIVLHSDPEAVGFYYKLGMRTLSKELDKKIKDEIENADKDKREPSDVTDDDTPFMYIPDAAVSQWEKQIRQAPILHGKAT